MSHLGRIVRKKREARGWTLREAAERTQIPGMNADRLSKLERGTRNVSAFSLQLIAGLARAFDEDPTTFLLESIDESDHAGHFKNTSNPEILTVREAEQTQSAAYQLEIKIRKNYYCHLSAPSAPTTDDLQTLIEYLIRLRNASLRLKS